MITDKIIVQDGQTYNPGDEVPDMGSWVAVEAKGNIRHYEGIATDFSKLPHYVDTGSSALSLDTSQVWKFHKPTDTWYELG